MYNAFYSNFFLNKILFYKDLKVQTTKRAFKISFIFHHTAYINTMYRNMIIN